MGETPPSTPDVTMAWSCDSRGMTERRPLEGKGCIPVPEKLSVFLLWYSHRQTQREE